MGSISKKERGLACPKSWPKCQMCVLNPDLDGWGIFNRKVRGRGSTHPAPLLGSLGRGYSSRSPRWGFREDLSCFYVCPLIPTAGYWVRSEEKKRQRHKGTVCAAHNQNTEQGVKSLSTVTPLLRSGKDRLESTGAFGCQATVAEPPSSLVSPQLTWALGVDTWT